MLRICRFCGGSLDFFQKLPLPRLLDWLEDAIAINREESEAQDR